MCYNTGCKDGRRSLQQLLVAPVNRVPGHHRWLALGRIWSQRRSDPRTAHLVASFPDTSRPTRAITRRSGTPPFEALRDTDGIGSVGSPWAEVTKPPMRASGSARLFGAGGPAFGPEGRSSPHRSPDAASGSPTAAWVCDQIALHRPTQNSESFAAWGLRNTKPNPLAVSYGSATAMKNRHSHRDSLHQSARA